MAQVYIPGVPEKHQRHILPLLALAGLGYLAYRNQSRTGATDLSSLLSPVISIGSEVTTDVGNVVDTLGRSLTSQKQLGPGQAVPASAPLGIRNNNPGNITPSLIPFLGQTGTNGGKVVFSNPVYGLRAMYKLLMNYQKLYGINTIGKIGARWTATDQPGWIANVSSFSGIDQNAALNMGDFGTATAIAKGIIGAENGSSWANNFSNDMFVQAWGML